MIYAIIAAYEDRVAVVSDNEVSTLPKGLAMRNQQRSSVCVVKLFALVMALLTVIAAISALLYISPRGIPLPTINLSPNAWCGVVLAVIFIVALAGLSIDAKNRENKP